jgi:hypothetical protein
MVLSDARLVDEGHEVGGRERALEHVGSAKVEANLGFGRIGVSEIELPNMLVNTV